MNLTTSTRGADDPGLTIEGRVSDLVKLRITDSDDPGRDAEMVMRRGRAEEIVSAGLGLHWPRYQFAIGPVEERPPVAKSLAAFLAVVAFLKAHASLIVPLAVAIVLGTLAVLSIHLPQAQHRVYAVGALALLSFFTGFLCPRPEPSLLK